MSEQPTICPFCLGKLDVYYDGKQVLKVRHGLPTCKTFDAKHDGIAFLALVRKAQEPLRS